MDLLTPKFEIPFDNDTNVDDKQYYNNDWNIKNVGKKQTKRRTDKKRTVRTKQASNTKTKTAAVKYKKKRQQCPRCATSYSKREYLSKHMLNAHNVVLEKKRPGRECPFYVKNADNPNRPYKCDQCVKEYAKSKHLARHRRTHLEKEPCSLCNEIFVNYAEHMLKKHGIELPRPFECDICKRTYRTKTHIQTHMRIHRAESRTFVCKICSKSFYLNTDLRKHMRTHSQDRSIICDICGAAFKSADTLKCHLRRHTGERPYKCLLCPRAFSTSNSLDIHNRTHTGERPFQCEVCAKAFSDASTLHVHKRLHTNENPYVCHLCGRRTKQASNLRSHYKHFHKNNDITGRQIRLNSRILNRFPQSELDAQLQEVGDLMILLEQGLQKHYQEEREKSNQIEKALKESIGTPRIQTQPQPPSGPLLPPLPTVIEDVAELNVKMEDTFSSFDNSDIEVDVKMEVDEFDAFDSVQSLMETETEYIPPPLPTTVKTSKYNLRRDNSGAVNHVQPKIESVFLEDGVFQAVPDVVDFSLDKIKSESESNDDDDDDVDVNGDDNQGDQADDDWQSDKNDNADAVPEVKKYKKKRQYCTKCSMSYSKREYLSKHMQKEHNEVLEKKRPGKGCEFFDENDTTGRPYKCDECDKQYMRSKHLARHRRTHFEKRRCNQCNEDFSNLSEHMLNMHPVSMPFDAISNVNVKNEGGHLNGHHENQSNGAYDRNDRLKMEIMDKKPSKTVQNNPPGGQMDQYQSESDEANGDGNEGSTLNPKVKRKKLKEGNDESTRCIPCKRKFHDIRKHWVQYHSGLERPFECYVCHRNYKRFEHIRYHLKTHGDERNYQCHVCGEAFFLSNELRKHFMYRHQVERPFSCTHPQCKKSFKNMHALNVHNRTHSGAKPFRCKHSSGGVVCSEAFAALSSLRIHERKHTGEKPYVCQFCNKAFADCSTHKQHVRIHTGDKPYRCHMCDRRTAQAGNLKSHYRHYHKVIVKSVSMYLDPTTRTMADDNSANPYNHDIATYPLFDPARPNEE